MPRATDRRRLLRHLRHAIEDCDLPRREIAAQAGISADSLAQQLRGRVDLRYRHLIAILQAIDYPPTRFFADVFEPAAPPTPERDAETLERLKLDRDVVRLYSFGIESILRLRERLERCENTLRDFLENRAT